MSRAIFRSTSLVGAMTFLSRVTGLIREMLFAQLFGAGVLMDAFLVAFKIPNFLRRLFAEGAFSQAFVPVISEFKVQRAKEDVRELVGGVAGTLGAMLFVITLIGVLAAPVVILIFAPGFTQTPGKYELAVHMLRFTFPYIFFISLTAFFSGVLNSYGRFGVPAMTQVIGNLVMIAAAIVAALYSSDPATTLALGVFASGLLQVVFQLPSVARLGLLARPRWQPALEGVRRIGRLMLPGIFGSSMAQVSLLLDVLIASFLVTGSIAWLYFADRLVEFPLGVFSIALATVILPGLSAHHAESSPERFTATLDWAVRLVVLLATPAAIGLFALAGPLTATVYGYGRFSDHDVLMATYALMAYSWGLLGFSFVKVLAPGYFARQDTRTPVRVGVFSLGVNMTLNVMFVLPAYYWLDFPTPHVLLATSTSISAAVNSALLLRGLKRSGVYRPTQGWRAFLLRVLAANAAMGTLLIFLAGPIATWTSASALDRTGRLAVLVAAGAATYFAVAYVVGLRPAHLRTEAR